MTKQPSPSKENKPTGLKTFINVLKPIRDWLKSTPSLDSNISSTPISSSNNSNISSYRDENNSSIYPMPNHVTMRRYTPVMTSNGNHNGTNNGNHIGIGGGLSGSTLYDTPIDLNASQNASTLHISRPQPIAPMVEESFKRDTKARMSLPIMQHNRLRRQAYTQLQRRGPHHQQLQSLGHIYLQHKGETKQATLPNELTAIDTIRALFVCAFPNVLSMEYMSQPHVKIYIYNPRCNIFYELHDIDDVKHESVLRIHQSDPIFLALPQQYQTMRMAPQIPPQIPPPKPRRMIPINGLQHNPNVMYGIVPQQQQHSTHYASGDISIGYSKHY